MAMKDYSGEFKADAVALYESTPGAIYKSIAADLGVNRATLRAWVLRDRERRGVTAAAAKPGAQPREAVGSADPDERVRQLEARVAELEASERKLATERDIAPAEKLIRPVQAACWYSWRTPPSRRCRRMSRWVICSGSVTGIGKGCSGRALAMPW
ncbi:transposase [Streptomyces sp. NPDC005195]|uniref:transposase n=1 Tax=Streptomyces sp. NPDC005195 TaxID=3154561 RepID=UPI0033BFA505